MTWKETRDPPPSAVETDKRDSAPVAVFPVAFAAGLFLGDRSLNFIFRLRDHRLRLSSPEYANPVAPNVDDYGTSIPRPDDSPKCYLKEKVAPITPKLLREWR